MFIITMPTTLEYFVTASIKFLYFTNNSHDDFTGSYTSIIKKLKSINLRQKKTLIKSNNVSAMYYQYPLGRANLFKDQTRGFSCNNSRATSLSTKFKCVCIPFKRRYHFERREDTSPQILTNCDSVISQ